MQDVPENSKYIFYALLSKVKKRITIAGDSFGQTHFDYNKALFVLGVKPSLFHSMLTTGQSQEVIFNIFS